MNWFRGSHTSQALAALGWVLTCIHANNNSGRDKGADIAEFVFHVLLDVAHHDRHSWANHVVDTCCKDATTTGVIMTSTHALIKLRWIVGADATAIGDGERVTKWQKLPLVLQPLDLLERRNYRSIVGTVHVHSFIGDGWAITSWNL